MTDITTTLKECHRIVWSYREMLEPFWPCPDIWDSLLFCQTELGEAIDAYLRTKPEYARNRDKDLSVLDELGDLALMALTSLGNELTDNDARFIEYGLGGGLFDFEGRDVERFSMYAAWTVDALDAAVNGYDDCRAYRRPILGLVAHLIAHPDMDLPARLTARLERIKAKRMPQVEVA